MEDSGVTADIGPVQVLAIGIGPAAEYRGQVLTELERLDGKGRIRVLDLLFVGVDDEADELVALNYQGDELGGLVGALLGFPFEGAEAPPLGVDAPPGLAAVGLVRADLEEMIRRAPPGLAIGVLLLEHLWARDFKRAIVAAGGTPLAEGFLSELALAETRAELAEMVMILDELEQEQTSLGSPSRKEDVPGGLERVAKASNRMQAGRTVRTVDRMERRRAMGSTANGRPSPPSSSRETAPYLVELEQLAALKGSGVLSDEEYEAKKRLVLGI